MQQNNRTNQKTFLNTIKEQIAYNLQNIRKISSGLCRQFMINLLMTPLKIYWKKFNTLQHLLLLLKTLLGNFCTKNLAFNLVLIEEGTVN